MSLAKLNIWIRFEDCRLVDTIWRTDLVIKACCGEYLIDMYPDVIAQLQQRYPDAKVRINRNYENADRILFENLKVPHIEVDVPPGCYIVWTRVCYNRNEETHKAMVIVRCGEEACVNLILPSVKTCARDGMNAFLARAKELNVPERYIGVAANVLAGVAELDQQIVANNAKMRLAELKEFKDIEGAREHRFVAELLNNLKPIPKIEKMD
jgi:hypothetical protein